MKGNGGSDEQGCVYFLCSNAFIFVDIGHSC